MIRGDVWPLACSPSPLWPSSPAEPTHLWSLATSELLTCGAPLFVVIGAGRCIGGFSSILGLTL